MISETMTRRGMQRVLPRLAAPRVAWQHLGLGLVLLLSAGLNCWNLAKEGYANSYYAAAVKSMLQSWHNFFFVSFDPGGFVTVDKPPLGFWIQTASAKLFGFHGWSILLPEALAGVLSVTLLYHLVRRIFGPTTGLIAALALAVTPISVVTDRNNTIDSLLVLTVLCAAWATLKAVETGRLRWLLLSMTLVGLGFNIKMLEAYLVLPALVLVYLLGAPHRWRTRILHLALGLVILLAVSLSWAVAVDLTSAGARPYVGSTQDNSELSLALGYNGLNRLLGNNDGPRAGGSVPGGSDGGIAVTGQLPGAVQIPSTVPSSTDGQLPGNPPVADGSLAGGPDDGNGGFPGGGPGGGGPGGTGENGAKGVLRLLDPQLAGQIGWLLPLALVGLFAAGWRLFIRPFRQRGAVGGEQPTDEIPFGPEPATPARAFAHIGRTLRTTLNARQQSVVLWGMWFATMAAFFSVAGMFHRYYLSMLAPGIAALAAIGIAVLWRAYRRRQPLGWLLPAAFVGTAVVQAKVLAEYAGYRQWMTPLILGIGVAAALALLVARIRPVALARRRLGIAAVTAGLCALLVAPTVWAAVSVRDGGGGGLPAAGPQVQGQGFPGGGNRVGGMPADMGGGTDSALIAYLTANRGDTKYLVAVPSSQSADAIILSTGEPVMAMGGFTGSDPILTADSLAKLVQDGTVRYFLLGGGGPGGGFGGQQSATSWVTTSCTAVPSRTYQSSGTSAGTGTRAGGFGGVQQLYDCGSAATKG
jgi:4-amino-4-deoxy-L-arabinose transferase-like glycosyltransferase